MSNEQLEENKDTKTLSIKKRYLVAFLIVLAVIIGGFIYNILGYESTDDAYVETTTVTVSPKEAKYDYQTMIYILAVKNFFKTENVTFVYLDLKNREEVCIKYSAELEKEYIQKLTQTAKKLNHTDKSINKKESCICEYSKICL